MPMLPDEVKPSPNKEWNDFDTRLDSQKFVNCAIMRQRRCPETAGNSKRDQAYRREAPM
jgi:hypothetical protein